MKNLPLYASFFLLASLFPLSAETTPIPVGEAGKIAFSDTLRFKIEMKNDSIASLSDGDWDDFRTFGMYYGVSWKDWTVEFTSDALTNRGTSEKDRGRIDELYGNVSRKLLDYEEGPLSVRLSAGAGILALGDFWGYEVQKDYHARIGNERPIPDRYDDPDLDRALMTHALAQLALDTSPVPVNFHLLLEGGQWGFLRMSAFAETGELKRPLGLTFFGGLVYARNFSQFGDTFAGTMESENGVTVGSRIDNGLLSATFAYNVSASRQAASFAFKVPVERRDEAAGEGGQTDGGSIAAIDFNLNMFDTSVRAQASVPRLRLPFALALRPLLGVGSGTFRVADAPRDGTIHHRYEEAYLGLDLSRVAFSWMDLYLMASFGVRKEQRRTRTIAASRVLETRMTPLALAEGGARFFVPTKKGVRSRWGLGCAVGLRFADSLSNSVSPYGQLRLIAISDRRSRKE